MKREDFKEIIELPVHFEGKGSERGFIFDQIYNNNGWYIYKVKLSEKATHYEVFKETIKQYTVYENGWTNVDNVGKVFYPWDEAFGYWAWSCKTIECCMKYITGKRQNRT